MNDVGITSRRGDYLLQSVPERRPARVSNLRELTEEAVVVQLTSACILQVQGRGHAPPAKTHEALMPRTCMKLNLSLSTREPYSENKCYLIGCTVGGIRFTASILSISTSRTRLCRGPSAQDSSGSPGFDGTTKRQNEGECFRINQEHLGGTFHLNPKRCPQGYEITKRENSSRRRLAKPTGHARPEYISHDGIPHIRRISCSVATSGTIAWYAEDLDNGFVSPSAYGTSDINCHINAEPGALTGSVAAGDTVEFQWSTWPHGIGPVLTYVAACDGDCADADKIALKWVKIDDSWTTTVPSTLAAGNYVFRHEIIALHGAGSANGAQSYPQCVNITITGFGTDSPEGTLGTDLYAADGAGILFNPYAATVDYTIPGPALYGSGSTTTTSAIVAASTAAASTASSAAVTTSAAAASATTSSAPVTTGTPSAGDDGDDDACDAGITTEVVSAAPTTLVTRTSSAAGHFDVDLGLRVGRGPLWAMRRNQLHRLDDVSSGTCTIMNDYYSQCV
ncbi:glycosyl hydrolase family 61-domain-containing protein [Xylariales sp. AK1849]|nr:glycosyl hydrolase family 61-domain-containing protein [Xylariales sp. AK1849]